jgi:hypothetical protein
MCGSIKVAAISLVAPLTDLRKSTSCEDAAQNLNTAIFGVNIGLIARFLFRIATQGRPESIVLVLSHYHSLMSWVRMISCPSGIHPAFIYIDSDIVKSWGQG